MKTKSSIFCFVFNRAYDIKTLKKYSPVLPVILAILFLSWDHFNNSKTGLKDLPASFHQDDSENEEHYGNQVPAAEDVLVQRIPGDNSHLLMMAFYSKENYAGKFLTLWDGSGIVFRDDGQGFDKKAGDGLYTAKIAADVKAFRAQVVSMAEQMMKSNYRTFRYDHRVMVYDPDAAESFDVQKFD